MKFNYLIYIGIGTFLLISILMATSFVMSADLTTKSYNETSKEVIFKVGTEELGSIKLDTPHDFKVPAGYQMIAEYTCYNSSYCLPKKIEFYNATTNQTIERQVDYKYLSVGTKKVDDYTWECIKTEEINKSSGKNIEECKQVLSGNHFEDEWLKYDNTIKSNKEIKIGLFTDVQVGDYIEWIPTYEVEKTDIRVNEWAYYSASVDTGIVAMYPTNDSSGVYLTDLFGGDDTGINVNTPTWGTNFLRYNGAGQYTVLPAHLETGLNTLTGYTIAMNLSAQLTSTAKWLYTDTFAGVIGAPYIQIGSSVGIYVYAESSGGTGICQAGTGHNDIRGTMPIVSNMTYGLVYVLNQTGQFTWLSNGSGVSKTFVACTATGTYKTGGSLPAVGDYNNGTTTTVDGKIGQLTYWSRSLTNDEAYLVLNKLNGTASISNTCTYTSGNYSIDCSEGCNITTNTAIGNNCFIGYGAGNINIHANISSTGCKIKHNGCTVTIFNEGGFR